MTALEPRSVTHPRSNLIPNTPIVRAFSGLATLGSGLVHFAIAPQQSILFVVLLAIIATSELILALGILGHRIRVTAAAAIFVSAPTVVWALLALVTDEAGSLPLGPMLTAAALGLFAALLLATSHRLHASRGTAARPWTFAAALVVGAAILPIVAVPAIVEAQYPSSGQPAHSYPNEHHHH
ncbi:hypothetical protein [Paramicrobacterium chengjingii]|uniref:hypothetical protein n=1 Tax=Paramicrobacterium chengjingii TaxID=2769067 RepID=UPI00141DEDD3|nr:hypothetical protein [Microbacterium chengjingii]